MKWKNDRKPIHGEIKVKYIFPIKPKLINNYWYWLTLLKVEKEYIGMGAISSNWIIKKIIKEW